MSCRVLKRGMENFVLNSIISYAKEHGYQYVKGEYIPTAKNEMVKDHYKNLGFIQDNNYWVNDVSTYINKKSFITVK